LILSKDEKDSTETSHHCIIDSTVKDEEDASEESLTEGSDSQSDEDDSGDEGEYKPRKKVQSAESS
jgi:hypothetical protein